MSDRWVRRGDLGVTRLLTIFAFLALTFLAVLAIAPARSHFTEWRAVQQRYNALARAQGKEPVAPAIQQVWNPKLRVVDRCTSCHVGMGPAGPVAGERLFAAHPPIPHDPAEIGCTLCHGGQGRATSEVAAHGTTRHWDEPTLEPPFYQSGCGSCHTHLSVPSERAGREGEALFRRYDCQACHPVDGVGRGTGPVLSYAGVRGFAPGWYARHEELAQAAGSDPAWSASWGAVGEEHRAVIEDYLASRVGAPRLLEAKALAHRMGCRGCHKIHGVGGDDGPDLSAVGRKIAGDLDYSGVRGEHTLPSWLEEHFRDPARIVKGSLMPDLALTAEDSEMLTRYMLSLRGLDVPQEYWPSDRIRGARLGERDFATDGESLFGAFCAGCHGERGEGRRYGAMGVVFPAIGNPDFLAIASDDYLRRTVTHGRSGRRMPAWGEKEGGLRASEIDAVVRYLRSLAPGTPEAFETALPTGVAAEGERIFTKSCQGCHGPRGEGREAPAIGHPSFLAAATDQYIAASVLRGRTGTSMRHFGQASVGFPTLSEREVADVVAYLRSLQNPPSSKASAAPAPGVANQGAQS